MKTLATGTCRAALMLVTVVITAPSLAVEEEGHQTYYLGLAVGYGF